VRLVGSEVFVVGVDVEGVDVEGVDVEGVDVEGVVDEVGEDGENGLPESIPESAPPPHAESKITQNIKAKHLVISRYNTKS
jgi:hypothetical protein